MKVKLDAGIRSLYYDTATGVLHCPTVSLDGQLLLPSFVQTGFASGTINNVTLGSAEYVVVVADSSGGTVTITGWADGEVGKIWAFVNTDSADSIVLKHQNAGSLAANRFTLPGATDLTLGPGEAVLFYRAPQAFGSHICISSSHSGSGGGGGLSDGDYGDVSVSGSGTVITIDSHVVTPAKASAATNKIIRTWTWTGGGGGVAIIAGDGTIGYNRIPQDSDYVIKRWTLMAEGSGSCTVDVFADTFANYPPTPADTICGGNKPAIGSGTSAEAGALSLLWSVTLSPGMVIGARVDSLVGFTWLTLQIEMEKN